MKYISHSQFRFRDYTWRAICGSSLNPNCARLSLHRDYILIQNIFNSTHTKMPHCDAFFRWRPTVHNAAALDDVRRCFGQDDRKRCVVRWQPQQPPPSGRRRRFLIVRRRRQCPQSGCHHYYYCSGRVIIVIVVFVASSTWWRRWLLKWPGITVHVAYRVDHQKGTRRVDMSRHRSTCIT